MKPMHGLFILGGIALLIVGLNGQPPLAVVGLAMMALAVLGHLAARR